MVSARSDLRVKAALPRVGHGGDGLRNGQRAGTCSKVRPQLLQLDGEGPQPGDTIHRINQPLGLLELGLDIGSRGAGPLCCLSRCRGVHASLLGDIVHFVLLT